MSYKAGLKVFTVSQLGDLPFFLFFFFVLARFQTTATGELLLIAPLAMSEYLLVGVVSVHLLTAGACCLQVALFLKAAQWFFYP